MGQDKGEIIQDSENEAFTTCGEGVDGAVLERLEQISKKLDGLNKCSISTVQMAKKVYAGLEDVKQVTGNFRAEIGRFHTTATTVTQDLKQVDYAIVSMHRRIEDTCSSLEHETNKVMRDMVKEQQQILSRVAKEFLAALETDDEDNPINKVRYAVVGTRFLAFVGAILGLINLVLLIVLVIR